MKTRAWPFLAVVVGLLVSQDQVAAGQPTANGGGMGVGRIIGLGGVFIRSKDPKALAAWYQDVLGLNVEGWGGAVLAYDAPAHPPVLVWNPLPQTSKYMAPSTREFMIDFAVDDLDAILARIAAKGVRILGRDDKDPNGRFAWIMDPDGTKIELWQPKAR